MKKTESRFSAIRRIIRRIIRLIIFSLLLTAVLLYLALRISGLPAPAVERVRAELNAAGIPLKFDSIHLTLRRGWVLENAKLYTVSPDELKPLLSAPRFYITTWPAKNSGWNHWNVKIHARNIHVSPGTEWDTILPANHPFNTITRADASLRYEPGRIALSRASATWGGVNFRAGGAITFETQPATTRAAVEHAEADAAARRFQRNAARAADFLSRLSFERTPVIAIQFNADTTQPELTTLNATLRADRIVWNKHRYNSFAGDFNFSNQVWTVSHLNLRQPDGSGFNINGQFDSVSEETEISLNADIETHDFMPLFPDSFREDIAAAGAEFFGRLNFSVNAGPLPALQIFNSVRGEVRTAGVRYHNITVESLALQFASVGGILSVTNITGNPNGGTARANLELDLHSLGWTLGIQARCLPDVLNPVASRSLLDFCDRFSFPNRSLTGDLILTHTGVPGSLTVNGNLAADHFNCAGIPLTQMSSTIAYANDVLRLDPLNVQHDDEAFNGFIELNFATELAQFDAVSTIPPSEISQFAAPDKKTVLNIFEFNGPVHLAAAGQLDFGIGTNHAFRGSIRAERAGMDNFMFDSIRSSIDAKGALVNFNDTVVNIFDGTIAGSAAFDLYMLDGSAPYQISATIQDVNFSSLLTAMTPNDRSLIHGTLSGGIQLNADAAGDFWKSVNGIGFVNIGRGHLADLPFFGGLARLMRATVPFFSIFTLTDFAADFTLHNAAVHSENAHISGTLFSAAAHGNWSPENGLNFIARAEPLRQAAEQRSWYQLHHWVSDALKLTTSPLFRIFEIRLTGDLTDPNWQMANFTRDPNR